jgi:arylsulfatase A-like enzyme
VVALHGRVHERRAGSRHPGLRPVVHARDAAGWRTGLFGKYLNRYRAGSIPPGWDRWVAFAGESTVASGGAYYDYDLEVDGTIRGHGRTPDDYSTDVLAARVVAFVEGTPADQPLFAWFAPFAPHGDVVPAPRHADAYASEGGDPPPSLDETDRSDKPRFLSELDAGGVGAQAWRAARREEGRALLAVDEAVGEILQALARPGRLADTIVVYTSDNGLLFGEHGWQAKQVAYEEAIRVPLAIRHDARLTAGAIDGRLALDVDVAPTIAALAGVGAPGAEGRALFDARGRPTEGRADFLVEHMQGGPLDGVPTYCAVRTERDKYVYYATGERELYDLSADPYEMQNRAGDPAYAARLAELHARLRELCRPAPPGWDGPPANQETR